MTKDQIYNTVLEYFKGDTLATNVWIGKYCMKNKKGELLENSPNDMHHRIAKELARIEFKYPNPLSEGEIYALLQDFEHIVPQGSPMAGIGNDNLLISISNCLAIGNNGKSDSYGNILKMDEQLIQLMKRRCGVGLDLSHFRPFGSMANNAILNGMAGSVLFAQRFSNSTKEVRQGDNRRGALMETMSVNHPDSERFIDSKMESGYINDANISIKITDSFMHAVKNNMGFIQTFPVDMLDSTFVSEFPCETSDLPIGELVQGISEGCYAKRADARKLWHKIIVNAHKSAEPGVLFWDTIIKESIADCYDNYETVTTNPCLSGTTIVKTTIGYMTIHKLYHMWKDQPNMRDKIFILGCNIESNTDDFYPINDVLLTKHKARTRKINMDITPTAFDGIKELILTDDHPIFIQHGTNHSMLGYDKPIGFVNADAVDVGMVLRCPYRSYPEVKSIEENYSEEDVFDIQVKGVNNFYANGYLVHNCGEVPLCEFDSCRLLLLNLYSYVINPFQENSAFNYYQFQQHVQIAQRLMDDIVDLEIEKIDKIIAKIESDPESDDIKSVELNLWKRIREKAIEGRRTGLGITGEGDMIAAMGLTYGTDKATEFATQVHKTLAVNSYISSIKMAKERGHFKDWEFEKEKDNPFLIRVLEEIKETKPDIYLLYKKFGRRNIANLTISPAGSVSLLTQTTSGIEPCFKVFYKRRVRTIDKDKATFIDDQGEMFTEYNVFHHKFTEWYDKNWYKTNSELFDLDFKKPLDLYTEDELNKLIEKSPYHKATTNDVDWLAKVKMQGSIQKWVDHSISVTVNVPKETTVDTVDNIYMTAFESGCKGMTIYRDGSRSGILVSNDDNNEKFNYADATKRPKVCECDIYHKTALKQNWMILVGKVDNKPYEIFAFPEVPNHIFPSKIEKGKITKVKSRTYKLTGIDGKLYEIPNIIDLIDNANQVDTRKFSLMLRHHVDPKWIVQDISEYALINSFSKIIARVLRNYMKGEKQKCPECGQEMTNADGCLKCVHCGYSKCN